MKQKRVKPRPICLKNSRSGASSEELANLEHTDWVHDCKMREYKKSDKYKEGQKLVEKFKSKLP